MRQKCQTLSAGILSVFLAASASASTVTISFEEIGAISGGSGTLAFPSTINGVDIGAMPVFDTVKAGFGRMSSSSPNAGLLERAISYRIAMSDRSVFRFQSIELSRSNNEPSFFRLEGLRDEAVLFSEAISDAANFLFPATFTANWANLDALRLLWSGPGAPTGFAAIDNFTFEPSPVPLPGTCALLGSSLVLIYRFKKRVHAPVTNSTIVHFSSGG